MYFLSFFIVFQDELITTKERKGKGFSLRKKTVLTKKAF